MEAADLTQTNFAQLAAECLKQLRELASAYPSQRNVIAETAADMADSWADRLSAEGVPWGMVPVLCNDARTTLRRLGKTAFPPNIEDLLAEWDKYQLREYSPTRADQQDWREHDAEVKGRQYSETVPAYQPLFARRGAAVVCHCRYERDGCDVPAQLSQDGTLWRCGNYLTPLDCGFRLLIADTATVPLPQKSYHGKTRQQREQQAMSTTAALPAALPTERPVFNDDELLEALRDRTGLQVTQAQREHWLEFARWLESKVPVDVWSRLVAGALYKKFKPKEAARDTANA